MSEPDVVVVGAGAAGLSGALMLARARRSVVVVDAGAPRNAPAAGVHGLLGRDGMPPAELLERGRAEVKALEARIYAIIEELGGHDIEVKGVAPLLLDFAGEREGRPVLWCWLEGDSDVRWYHRLDCGFPGRRPA